MPSFRIQAALAAAPMAALAACGRPAPPPAPPPPQVGYVVVQSQPVALTNELPGRVTAFVTADVRPQVNGIITERLFVEGGDVAKSQALYRIDPKPYQAALDQAKAQLANAQANVVTARLQAQRYADLVKIDAISRQDNDNAQASYGQAAANVQQYRATVEAAQINLGYTTVRAPVSGRIGRSLVTIGALATSGQTTALATIQALDPIYVDVTQSADELLRLRQQLSQGDATKGAARVSVVLSDGQRYPVEGELRFAEAQVDPTTGSVILRAVFPNPNRTLLPGMFVREVLTQAVVQQGVLAPQTAIARDPKGAATAMIVVNGAAQVRPVTIDRAVGSNWLITSGLKPGDELITAGGSRVQQPGTKVQAVPAAQLGAAAVAPAAGGKPGGASGQGGANGTPSSAGRG